VKLLFLAYRDSRNPFVAGGDIYINNMAKRLVSLGHSVTLVSSTFSSCRKKEVIDGVNVIRMGTWLTMFLRVFVFYTKHPKGSFDVVIEEVIGGQRLPFFASVYVKCRLIGIWHQRHKEIFKYQYPLPITLSLSFLERFLALLYRRREIIVSSYKTRDDLTRIGLEKQRIHVVHPGPGLGNNLFHRKICSFSSRKPTIVFLGKLRRYKLVHHALLATKIVHEKIPECKLIIAGRRTDVDFRYEELLQNLTQQLRLSKAVIFKQDIAEDEKKEILSESRVLVLPSAIEGFGIVVLEANACGTPVVVSSGIPTDVVIDRYNGLRYSVGDTEALSDALLEVLSNRKSWERMSRNALRQARRFSWARSAAKLENILVQRNENCA